MDTNHYMLEKINMTIEDYPKKDLIVADIIRLIDKKTHLTIFDRDSYVDGNEGLLYDNRAEFIERTSEGCASSICSKTIKYIDTNNDGSIEIYVDKNEDCPINIIKYNKDKEEFLYPIVLDKVDGGTLMVEYDPSEIIYLMIML